ncbi:MAG: helix-turn-helix transcriptional regulator [Pseudomonadota bacterium]
MSNDDKSLKNTQRECFLEAAEWFYMDNWQDEMVAHLGLSKSTVAAWRKGKGDVDPEVAKALYKHLVVDIARGQALMNDLSRLFKVGK